MIRKCVPIEIIVYEDLWKQSEDNLKFVATLEAKIANSERLALFGERKLNKWRSRNFSS